MLINNDYFNKNAFIVYFFKVIAFFDDISVYIGAAVLFIMTVPLSGNAYQIMPFLIFSER